MSRTLATIGLIMSLTCGASIARPGTEIMRIPSGVGRLSIAIRHQGPAAARRGQPVLILHGATFPSANAAAWKFAGRSWMDELADAGYDVYALDFLGYGESDRFDEMSAETTRGAPLGDLASMLTQVEHAVSHVLQASGARRIHLIAHSGGTLVAARYAELHGERVERLVLFGAPVPLAPDPAREPVAARTCRRGDCATPGRRRGVLPPARAGRSGHCRPRRRHPG